MHFDKIGYDGTTVTLARREQSGNNVDTSERESTNEPNPEFKRAMTAFRRHVLDCAPFLADVRDLVDIRSVHLKLEKKTSRRTLQVTCVIALEACSDKTIVITTPYMTEPAEDAGDPSGFLEKHILKMMDTIEECATSYFNGEHKGQIELVKEPEPRTNGKHEKGAKRGGSPSRVGDLMDQAAD